MSESAADLSTGDLVQRIRSSDPGAEEELRIVFDKIGRLMQQEAPFLFGDFIVADDGAWRTDYRKV